MNPRIALISALLLSALPGGAMDVSGIVLNKSEQPIPLAQVCFKNNPSRCVATSINGTFRITDGAPVLASGPRAGWSLELRGERLALTAPRGMSARLAFLDPSGRSLAPARQVGLSPGRNLLDMPALPRNGVHIIRLTTPEATLAWKALLLDGARGPDAAAGRNAGVSLSALSKKAAAVSELQVTKSGFRPELYLPLAEVETDAFIVLTATTDSGFAFTSTFKAKNTLDRAKGSMITEATVDTCNGPTPVPATFKDTLRYAVRDGKLYQWYEGQCVAEVATGSGTDPVGTWTFTQSGVYLPQDLRPAACKDTIPVTSVPATVKAQLVIAEAEQSFSVTAELCPPDYHMPFIFAYLLADTTITITTNTCRKMVFRNGKGEEATLSYSRRGEDSLASSFTYKTATCNAVEGMRSGDGVPIDCSGADPLLAFLICMDDAAFFGPAVGPAPLAKRAPLPDRLAPRTAALPASLHAFRSWDPGAARALPQSRELPFLRRALP